MIPLIEGRHVIETTKKTYRFYGRFLRDEESEHWHYYQITRGLRKGRILHVRKEHLVAVLSESSK